MNRLRTFTAILLLTLGIPATSEGQITFEDLIKAHGRTEGKSNTFDSWQMMQWLNFNRAGWRAINKGYFETAEHEFKAAIEIARASAKVDGDNRLLARSYADFAYAIQKQGRHAEAEPLVKWALVARERELEAGSPAIAQTLNQLAVLYYEVGRFNEAEPLLTRAIDSQGKSAKPSPVEQARSQTLLGLLMVTQHRYNEAEKPFLQAVAIRERTKGTSQVDTGDALSNLAWVYLQEGKNEKARPLFLRALKIFEEFRGSIDPSVAHTLRGLAKIQTNEGEQEEAEAKYLRAIAIWDARPELDAQALVEVLKDYASFLEKLGRAEDLVKIKARLTPLQAKFSAVDTKAGPWFHWPNFNQGTDLGIRRGRS